MSGVLDTNAVIYLQKGLLAEALPPGRYLISVVTEMELLSFPELDDLQRDWLRKFIAAVTVIALDDPVKEEAIELRRNHRLRLPDAIIAASAITSKAVLFTNDEGLRRIPGLEARRLQLRPGNTR